MKPPAFIAPEAAKEKKKFVAPEDKARQKMVDSIFGGNKVSAKKPVGPKAAQPSAQKKAEKVETTDLI